MDTAIIGAGAIGTLVAAYLAQKGENVVPAARPGQREMLAGRGLSVEGVRGSLRVDVPIVERLEKGAGLIVLATKTGNLGSAISMNEAAFAGALLLTVQNGVRAEEIVASRLRRESLFASIVMFGATYAGPGGT